MTMRGSINSSRVCLKVCERTRGNDFKVRAIRIKTTEKSHALNSQILLHLPLHLANLQHGTVYLQVEVDRDGSTEITALFQKDPAEYMWTYIAMYNLNASHAHTHTQRYTTSVSLVAKTSSIHLFWNTEKFCMYMISKTRRPEFNNNSGFFDRF